MSTSVEEFLKQQQRFECVPLTAFLTLAQCEANRKRDGFSRVFACISCAGLGKAVALQERIETKSIVEVATMSMCACGKPSFGKITDECRPCYDKRKHAERKAKKEAGIPTDRKVVVKEVPKPKPVAVAAELKTAVAAPAVSPLKKFLQPAPTLSMTLNFTNDSDIYHKLIEHNIDEEQIIGLLSMLLDGELQQVA